MSENKREKVKITIEIPNCETRVLECDGVALTTIEDLEDKYNCGVAVIGNLSIPDVLALKQTTENELVDALEHNLRDCARKHPLAAIFCHLGGN